MVESLLWRHFLAVSSPVCSQLFVADHEFVIVTFRTDKRRVAATAFLQRFSVVLQYEGIVVVPYFSMHLRVVSLRRTPLLVLALTLDPASPCDTNTHNTMNIQ